MIELELGGSSVTIDPDRGGRLAGLRIDGRELLLGPPPNGAGNPIGWGCYLMAPWPGRLAGGRFAWAGEVHQLPRTHGRHAIHGVVHDRPWNVTRQASDGVRMELDLGEAGWPLGGRVRQGIRLDARSLLLEAEIVADRSTPAALGWHPWFLRRGADPHVTLSATRYLETGRMIPTGRTLPVEGRTDLRAGPLLGARRLDHVFTDVDAPARIDWPDLELELAFEPTPATWVVHSPPAAFCIEPQTAWPDAFNRPLAEQPAAGVRVLEPGESLRATLRLDWQALAPTV